MSKKSQILSLLDEGKDYDEIQETVKGATRAYIRTVASAHRKNGEQNEVPGENEEKEEIDDSDGMDFDNDLENNGDNMTDNKGKSGVAYHKEWVKAKAYECNCGCTLNRKSDYCPHCGVGLNWEGI